MRLKQLQLENWQVIAMIINMYMLIMIMICH